MPFINDPSAQDGLPIVPLWINGAAHSIKDHALFPVTSSVLNKPIHHAVSATPTTATLACDSAAAAFTTWRDTTPTHRRTLLLKAADIIAAREGDITGAQMAETSCPAEFANFNVKVGAGVVREIAAATSELRGTVPQQATKADGSGEAVGGLTVVVREPIGVVLIIPP
jgi:acyl-CoA reductase-like NAD-dependent aldehyde dehydrogenase